MTIFRNKSLVIFISCLFTATFSCAKIKEDKNQITNQSEQLPSLPKEELSSDVKAEDISIKKDLEDTEQNEPDLGESVVATTNDLIKHDRPCDGFPEGACVFQGRTFMDMGHKKYEIIVAKDRFYIYQILDGANNKKFYYKDYELGYGKKVTELFTHNLTSDPNKKCVGCSVDSLDSYVHQDGTSILSISRKNFYENYKYNPSTQTWGEWIRGGTLTSVLGRYVKGSDTTIPNSKFPCDIANPSNCSFKTRASFKSGTSLIDSISTFNRYYNIEKNSAGSYIVWNSNGNLLDSVSRYKNVICGNLGANCSFDTRTSGVENNVAYESISARGKYFNFYKDAAGVERFFEGNLDSIPRYKTKSDGSSKIAKHGMTGGSCIDSRNMDANWGYNWGGKQNLTNPECAGLEFVSMHWGPTLTTSNPKIKYQSPSTPGAAWTFMEPSSSQLFLAMKTTLTPALQKSKELYLTHFPIVLDKVPDDAKITGIKVIIKRVNTSSNLGAIKDVEIKLVKKNFQTGAQVLSSNRAATLDWPSSSAADEAKFITYGSLEDLWGFASLSIAEIKDQSFGVRLSIQTPQNKNNIGAHIEYVALRVYYLPSLRHVQTHSNSKFLLGFNEPNFKSQANMTPEEAAIMWKKFEVDFAGSYSLIAPVPAQDGGDPNFDRGVEWLKSFWNAFRQKYGSSPKIHALATHCYMYPNYNNKPYDTSYCKNLIQQYINLTKTWNLPGKVWLTEFAVSYNPGIYDTYASLYGAQSVEYLKDGIKDMLAWLSTNNEIGRYSWFTNRRRIECFGANPHYNCPSMPLYVSKEEDIYGQPANYAGVIYRNFGEH